MGLGKWLKQTTGIDVTGIDLSAPIKDITGIDLGKAANWIDKTVSDIIPGGWTTLAEVGLSFTPLGVAGAAGFGALSGGTGGFKKKGFDLSGAIMGGLQGYGVGSLATSLSAAGAPPPAGAAPSQANMAYESIPTYTEAEGLTFKPLETAGTRLPNPMVDVPTEVPYAANTSANASTISGPQIGAPPAPSGLESLGDTMATNASNAGQGIQNLVGLGPQGVSGIMPTAQAINANMGYTAYAGLGAVALEQMAKKNEQDHASGATTNEEYEKNKRQIEQAVADANSAVQKYRYEQDPALTQDQATEYAKNPVTLYDQYALANQENNVYATGGSVDGPDVAEDMTTGGLAGGFKFNANNQLPAYAAGGVTNGLGSYAHGGDARFLSGGGDGMSDSIKATIDGHQEARLADGEFVIPADVVSHLGNGSSKAGAKQLHAMMDRIRKARTGNPKQGKQINPLKLMPA